jgi:phosphoribosylamine--glycine ligase
MESDLFTVMQKTARGTLSEKDVKFSDKNACCIIMASNGYPEEYQKGFEIIQKDVIDGDVFVAGAKLGGDKLLTNGGRVLGVTTIDTTLKGAIEKGYREINKIGFENAFYRHDIGARALKAKENN